MTGLPKGWTEVSLLSLVSHKSGDSKIIKGRQSASPGEGLHQGFSASGPDVWVDKAQCDGPGIVVSAVGARCGKTFLAKGSWTAIANTHVIIPKAGIQPKFLWYVTNREEWWIKSGTAQPFVKVRDTLERPFALPPIDEQEKIVQILEEQLSRLDAATDAIEAVGRRAEQFRKAALNAAFTGLLLAQYGGDIGSADEWERPSLESLLEVSIGGIWGVEVGTSEKDVAVVRVTELKEHGEIETATAVMRSVTDRQFSSRELKVGDLLLEKSGGGPNSPVGRVGLVRSVDRPMVCSNFMQLMRPDQNQVEPRYLHLYLSFMHSVGETIPLQTSTTNIRNIKTSDYLKIEIPLPALGVQRAIITAIDGAFTKLLDSLRAARTAEKQIAACRRSLLHAAFSGNLTREWREAHNE